MNFQGFTIVLFTLISSLYAENINKQSKWWWDAPTPSKDIPSEVLPSTTPPLSPAASENPFLSGYNRSFRSFSSRRTSSTY